MILILATRRITTIMGEVVVAKLRKFKKKKQSKQKTQNINIYIYTLMDKIIGVRLAGTVF